MPQRPPLKFQPLATYTVPLGEMLAVPKLAFAHSDDGFSPRATFGFAVRNAQGNTIKQLHNFTPEPEPHGPSNIPWEGISYEVALQEERTLVLQARSPEPIDSDDVSIHIPARQIDPVRETGWRLSLTDDNMDLHDVEPERRNTTRSKDTDQTIESTTTTTTALSDDDLRAQAELGEPDRLKRPQKYEDDLDRWWREAA
jgi:hypothetical protein